jgi:D-methionine transport system substrate-binding protein
MHAKNFIRRFRFPQTLAGAILALSAAFSHAQALTIGVTPGVIADSIQVAAAEAKRQGLEVRVVEMTDWTTPNVALQSGDLDLNYFQHTAFLENAIRERGYAFAIAGYGVLPNIGLFSTRIKSLAQLKDGATVAVANDPVNQGRGLLLLERAGLIKLKPGVGAKASLADIASNPKKLDFKEIEGPQLVRALDDVDLAQGYPAHLVAAGKPEIAKSGLQYSTVDDQRFAIVFVSRTSNAADPRIRKFITLYQQSPAVLAKIDERYAHDKRLYSLPWQKP